VIKNKNAICRVEEKRIQGFSRDNLREGDITGDRSVNGRIKLKWFGKKSNA
jgi:hypothetical protein